MYDIAPGGAPRTWLSLSSPTYTWLGVKRRPRQLLPYSKLARRLTRRACTAHSIKNQIGYAVKNPTPLYNFVGGCKTRVSSRVNVCVLI